MRLPYLQHSVLGNELKYLDLSGSLTIKDLAMRFGPTSTHVQLSKWVYYVSKSIRRALCSYLVIFAGAPGCAVMCAPISRAEVNLLGELHFNIANYFSIGTRSWPRCDSLRTLCPPKLKLALVVMIEDDKLINCLREYANVILRWICLLMQEGNWIK